MFPISALFKGVTMLSRMDSVQKLIMDKRVSGKPLDNEIVKSLVKKAEKKPAYQSKKIITVVLFTTAFLLNHKLGLDIAVAEWGILAGFLGLTNISFAVQDKK